MPKLTKKVIDAIPPQATTVYVWDAQLPGFGVKVYPNGRRRYVVKYRSGGGGRTAPQRWYTLGTHGAITADQARELAQQVLAAVSTGRDPQADKFAFRRAPVMEDLWARYETDHLPRKKISSAQADRHKWRRYIEPRLGQRKVADVTRGDIDDLHKALAARPYQANRVAALLSKLFNLAERWGMRPDGTNPCRHVEKYREQHRERYLNRDELVRVGDALRDALTRGTESPYAIAAVQLLLLTGARRNEVLTAKWEWVDFERRLLQLPDSKTGQKSLYLSHAAIDVLQRLRTLEGSTNSPYIIRGRANDKPLAALARPWQRICALANLEHVRLHDLRHTAASVGVAQGMNLPVIGRLLGHRHAATTQRYAHVDVDPALAAADRIAEAIADPLALDIPSRSIPLAASK